MAPAAIQLGSVDGGAAAAKPLARRPIMGMTLVELLVVLAIVAILLGVGVPNLSAYIATNRLSTAANEFQTALQLARSEAIRRGVPVGIQQRAAPGSRDWGTAGWQMFVDANRDGGLTAGEEVVREGLPAPSGITVYSGASFANSIVFDSTGRLATGAGGTFVICYQGALVSGGASRSRAVLVNGSGRTRLGGDADKDGVPETDAGTAVASCTNP